ncbi:MAG: hypothetical protein KAT69_07915 [Candidatus Aminicenantes bacterium]|nr:hypothetical protein [Candidatus Aminicenantes bacterium]
MDNFKTNLKDIERKLDIVLELFDDFKGFFKVMGWIGKLTVWTAKVGAILVAAWAIFEGHVK